MGWRRSSSAYAEPFWAALAKMALIVAFWMVVVVALWTMVFAQNPSGGGNSSASTTTPTTAATSSSSITARSAITASGSLQSRTRVVFGHVMPILHLSVPQVGSVRTNASFDPVIRRIRVLVDGKPVSGVPLRLLPGGRATVSLPPGTVSVDVAYEAAGVMARSRPTTHGRALVLATPLWVSTRSRLPMTLFLQGHQILNLGCWPPGASLEACGKLRRGTWEVHTSATSGAVGVVAQINLPERSSA
jgi:hypothetical protein